jgi:hypothetical protein
MRVPQGIHNLHGVTQGVVHRQASGGEALRQGLGVGGHSKRYLPD